MHHQRWVGRAAERCSDAISSIMCVGVGVCVSRCTTSAGLAGQPNGALDATSSVLCVGVGVCVPNCTTSAGLAGHPNGAWMILAMSGGGDAPPIRTPPPGTTSSVHWQGPDTVCVGRTPTSVRLKKYMEKVCSGFFLEICH